jgi:hypothetical protein
VTALTNIGSLQASGEAQGSVHAKLRRSDMFIASQPPIIPSSPVGAA